MSVIGHHLIWTNYGTWLPNDPRGSGSQLAYTPAIGELAEPHFGRRMFQPPRSVVREIYAQATPRLQFSVIRFRPTQFGDVASVLEVTIRKHRYTCAIMPDHVHLVIRKHRHQGVEMIDHFQQESRLRFSSRGALPAEHPLWTNGGWDRFLDSPSAVRIRICYVENNPPREGLPRQAWPFVVPYDNWPFHKLRRAS